MIRLYVIYIIIFVVMISGCISQEVEMENERMSVNYLGKEFGGTKPDIEEKFWIQEQIQVSQAGVEDLFTAYLLLGFKKKNIINFILEEKNYKYILTFNDGNTVSFGSLKD